jgi:hypothetical protein
MASPAFNAALGEAIPRSSDQTQGSRHQQYAWRLYEKHQCQHSQANRGSVVINIDN